MTSTSSSVRLMSQNNCGVGVQVLRLYFTFFWELGALIRFRMEADSQVDRNTITQSQFPVGKHCSGISTIVDDQFGSMWLVHRGKLL